jgi:DNA-binding winged helix-turn-helix (wHTH) protein
MAERAQPRVRVLGGLSVEGHTEHELGSRKGRTLLKVLALARGEPVNVDRLVDTLWARDMPARPADQVGVLVARLRAVLGTDRIGRRDGGYRLVADWLDLDELERRVEEAASAMAGGRLGAARASALAAVALARGGLLPGDEDEWVLAPRARVSALVAQAHQPRLGRGQRRRRPRHRRRLGRGGPGLRPLRRGRPAAADARPRHRRSARLRPGRLRPGAGPAHRGPGHGSHGGDRWRRRPVAGRPRWP